MPAEPHPAPRQRRAAHFFAGAAGGRPLLPARWRFRVLGAGSNSPTCSRERSRGTAPSAAGRKMWDLSASTMQLRRQTSCTSSSARTPDAAPAPRASPSYRAVPKYLVAEDGSLRRAQRHRSRRNQPQKMIRGTVNTAPVPGDGAHPPGGAPVGQPPRRRSARVTDHVPDDEQARPRR